MRDPVMIGPGGRQRRPRPLLRTTLGHILRRARREQGRTLADVAEAARVSMPYLSELERGRKEASSEVLAAVCDALRIELSDLLAQAGRNLADERARRALNEERARRIKERTGVLPAGFPVPAAELPADVPGSTGPLPADVSDRASAIPAAQPLDVPVVVPLDAVRRRGIPPAGHHDGDIRASLAA
jgi:transcriptional regulator with XRE-family HTH domain